MDEDKKYYFLKLPENFYERNEIKILEALPQGHIYSGIYIKLLLLSLNHDGELKISDSFIYTPEFLAKILRYDIDTIKSALIMLQKLEMIEILPNGIIYMPYLQDFVGRTGKQSKREVQIVKKEPSIRREKIKNDGQLILDYLNKKAGRRFRKVHPYIINRLKEYTIDELMAVIDWKILEWGDDNDMKKYLRPETLFNSHHFDTYLDEAISEMRIHKEKPINENIMSKTENFIEAFLSKDLKWPADIKETNQYDNLMNEMMDTNSEMISNYIKNMDYYDFLQTPYWIAIANKKRADAGYKCQLCGATDVKLVVHHNTYKHHGYEHLYYKTDLIVLCDECHAKYHNIEVLDK